MGMGEKEGSCFGVWNRFRKSMGLARATASAWTTARLRARYDIAGWNHYFGRFFELRTSPDAVFKLGENSWIDDGVLFKASGASLCIGRNVFVGRHCLFAARSGIEIGDDAMIAEGVSIHDDDHCIARVPGVPYNRMGRVTRGPVRIGANAWIASHAVILSGVQVGEGAVVGAVAVAVVTKDIPPYEIWGGIPARFLKAVPVGESGDLSPCPPQEAPAAGTSAIPSPTTNPGT